MITLVQMLGVIRNSLVTFASSSTRLWSGPETSCRDCVYHLTCGLAPGADCIARAGCIANRVNWSLPHGTMIDWWTGLGP
jgi:hypothetical protein